MVRKPSTTAPVARTASASASTIVSMLATGSPSSSTMVAPAGVDRGQRPDPDPQWLDERIDHLVRRAVAVDLGPDGRQERSRAGVVCGCRGRLAGRGLDGRSLGHGQILPGRRRLSSAGVERRPASRIRRITGRRPRACRDDAERPGHRPRLVGPVRLRQHDLLVRGRVRRHRALPRRAVRRARRERLAVHRRRRQRRHQRPRLTDPRRVLGPRCRPDAVPAVLHGRCASARRSSSRASTRSSGSSCSSSRTSPTRPRSSTTTRLLKTVSYPATRGQAVRARDRDRLLRHGLRRAADLLPRRAGRRPVPAHVHPVPGLRDPDLRLRARAADRRRRRP